MNDWKQAYPYTMDEPLKQALLIAIDNKDTGMIKKLWDIFVSYRKSPASV